VLREMTRCASTRRSGTSLARLHCAATVTELRMDLKAKASLLAVALCAGLCWGQSSNDRKIPGCGTVPKEHGSFPTGPFKFLPNESFKRSPTVKFSINEDGTVSNAKIVHSSGVRDIDRKLLDAVSNWKYKPNPGCGVVQTEMVVTIDWR
jgi:TonB family protein